MTWICGEMGYILTYVQGITTDEETDDIFCRRMVENYGGNKDGITRFFL